MTRALKTSGFVALAIQMLWGMYQVFMLTPQLSTGVGVPVEIRGAHAHFGILAILAIVLGLVIDHYPVDDRRKKAVTLTYISGQWLLPVTLVLAVALEVPQLNLLQFLWGLLLLHAMAVMALTVIKEEPGTINPV